MAADSIAGYIHGLLDGVAFTHTAYALDRNSRKSALAHFLGEPAPRGRAANAQQLDWAIPTKSPLCASFLSFQWNQS
jgi:hypothetical protein